MLKCPCCYLKILEVGCLKRRLKAHLSKSPPSMITLMVDMVLVIFTYTCSIIGTASLPLMLLLFSNIQRWSQVYQELYTKVEVFLSTHDCRTEMHHPRNSQHHICFPGSQKLLHPEMMFLYIYTLQWSR